MTDVSVLCLGQAGFQLQFGPTKVLIDPYLSHSVEVAEGARRLFPIVREPKSISDADFVFISHWHLDHCDPDTVLPIAQASPQCRFLGTYEVAEILKNWGVDPARVLTAEEKWIHLAQDLRVHPVCAAHPEIERDHLGRPRFAGFVVEYQGRRFYHSGDTKLHADILSDLTKLSPIEVAFLPVNEKNFFRDRINIIGNLTVREAFGFASELGFAKVVPMHWDMFELNSAYREEIEIVYEKDNPPFELIFYPEKL